MIALQLLFPAMLPALLGVGMVQVTPEVVPGVEKGGTHQLLMLFGHTFVCQKDVPSEAAALNASICNEDEVLDVLWPAMRSANAGARIYYASPCQADDADYLPFPKVHVRVPAKGLSGAAALRDAFADDPNVQVTEGAGTVGIKIGVPRAELLRTEIKFLRLNREDRFDARIVLMGIMGSKDVEAAEKRLKLTAPLGIADFTNPVPSDELPHLRHPIVGETLDRALDEDAATFNALVLYGEDTCRKPHLFDVNAVYPPDPDDILRP